MKVLIGTPIHESKDYSVERWLENVSKMEYPADLLLVDNSPGLSYVEKLKVYCDKYGLRPVRNFEQGPISKKPKNYRIEHIEFPPLHGVEKELDEQIHERITSSEELIRSEFLSSDYDAYFFWESDIIIPLDAIHKLVSLMQAGDFMVVDHNCWIRNIPNKVNFDFGITLFKRECLEKYSFLPESGNDPNIPPSWYDAENNFRKRLHKDGHNYAEVMGLLEPVHHLNK